MKVDLKRLDKMFMVELFRKYYGQDIPLQEIGFLSADSHVKVKHGDIGWIAMWENGEMSTHEMDMPMDIAWDIMHRLKVCSNCKWWDKDDMSCAKSGDSLHENNHGFSQKTSDKAFLYIDDDVIDVDIKDGYGGFKTVDGYFDADDVEKVVTVCFGENHSCGNHEYKEDK